MKGYKLANKERITNYMHSYRETNSQKIQKQLLEKKLRLTEELKANNQLKVVFKSSPFLTNHRRSLRHTSKSKVRQIGTESLKHNSTMFPSPRFFAGSSHSQKCSRYLAISFFVSFV